MESINSIPLHLLKQDPTTGVYKLGSIEMSATEYILATKLNEIQEDIVNIKKRLVKIEGK